MTPSFAVATTRPSWRSGNRQVQEPECGGCEGGSEETVVGLGPGERYFVLGTFSVKALTRQRQRIYHSGCSTLAVDGWAGGCSSRTATLKTPGPDATKRSQPLSFAVPSHGLSSPGAGKGPKANRALASSNARRASARARSPFTGDRRPCTPCWLPAWPAEGGILSRPKSQGKRGYLRAISTIAGPWGCESSATRL